MECTCVHNVEGALQYFDDDDDDDEMTHKYIKARFPLPELTARVNGPS